jgi:hypothetical protein
VRVHGRDTSLTTATCQQIHDRKMLPWPFAPVRVGGMTLEEWAKWYGHGAVTELLRRSGVSATTIRRAIRGEPLSRRTVAEKLSRATERKVSTESLLGLDTRVRDWEGG